MTIGTIHTTPDWIAEFILDARKSAAESRIIPFVIVAVFAGIMAHVEYIATQYAITDRMGEPPDWMDALMVIQWLAVFSSQFFMWVIYAAVVHCTAVIFDGRGKFPAFFFLTGYGYFPLAIAAFYIYSVVRDSLPIFTELAFSASPTLEKIPGLSVAPIFSGFAQAALAAWGAYCVILIHRLPLIKAVLCLAIPAGLFLVSKFLFGLIL